MLEHALKYASLNLKVFPIREGLKTPAIAKGFQAASSDVKKVNEWWGGNAKLNIAIRTGAESGIFSLDVDTKNGKNGFEWLNAQGDLPATVVFKTPSGGKQYIFRMPDFFVGSNSGKLAEGVDIRGEGGYFVAPPSWLKETETYKFSGVYEYMTEQGFGEIEIATAPNWLLDKLFELVPIEEP